MAAKKIQAQLTPEEKLQQALVPTAEQPYKVPANWCWTRLKFISTIISKGTTPKGGKSVYKNVGVNFLRVENIGDAGVISHDNMMCISEELHNSFLKRSILKEKDVLVSIAGTLGKTAIVKKFDLPMNTNQAISFIRLFHRFINEVYIKYVIDDPVINGLLLKKTKVTSIPNLTLEIIGDCPIPLPPLAEQQRIVERIESLFAKLDEGKENLQNVLDGFETRKAAILHKAFTGELTANWRKHHGLTMDSWEEKTLNDIASYKKGPFGSSITKAMFVPKTANTYKVYEQGNVIRKDLTYGHYYITSEKYQELKGFSVKAGDILISCAGTIGEVYKLPPECEEGVINQALMRVRLNQNIIEGYFCYYFGEIIKDDVIDKSNGTAMKNIPPFKVLKAIQIKLPTINEQTEIVRIVDNLLAKEQKAHSIAQNALAKIDLIKKSILVRAFRGQLATNNPADEPAVKLLERVL